MGTIHLAEGTQMTIGDTDRGTLRAYLALDKEFTPLPEPYFLERTHREEHGVSRISLWLDTIVLSSYPGITLFIDWTRHFLYPQVLEGEMQRIRLVVLPNQYNQLPRLRRILRNYSVKCTEEEYHETFRVSSWIEEEEEVAKVKGGGPTVSSIVL